MKLFVGINWDMRLIDEFDKLNQRYAPDVIDEVYGSMKSDPLGQVREAGRLIDISSDKIERFIIRAHANNISVCYAINSPLITPGHIAFKYRDVTTFLDWLENIGIDNVIVASPAFAKYLTKPMSKYAFGIIGSTVLNLMTLEQITKFQGTFDRICPATDKNRDTNFLYDANKIVSIELLVNEMCLFQCPWRNYHYCQEAANSFYAETVSMSIDDNRDAAIKGLENFPIYECWRCFMEEPSNIIKSRWVRPEDICIYEEIGIEYFKLSGRTMPTEWIIRTTTAYVSRKYKDNLLDLFPIVAGFLSTEKSVNRRFYVNNTFFDNVGRDLIIHDRGSCSSGCMYKECDFCVRIWEDFVSAGIAREPKNEG